MKYLIYIVLSTSRMHDSGPSGPGSRVDLVIQMQSYDNISEQQCKLMNYFLNID